MRLHTEPAGSGTSRAPGHYPAVFAEFMLPYRDPGPFARWQQQHDGRTATLHPTPSGSPMGGDLYPFGVLPRRLLAWMATTAVATGSRHLNAGKSLADLARTLGLTTDGPSLHRLRDQLDRLTGATVQIQDATPGPGGVHVRGTTLRVAEHYTTWNNEHRHWGLDGQDTGLAITLSSEFFTSIVTAPVPIDLHLLYLLGSSPLRTDLYLWTCHQLQQREQTHWHTTYRTFADTFGSRTLRPRRFHEALRSAARDVTSLHPDIEITADRGGLNFIVAGRGNQPGGERA